MSHTQQTGTQPLQIFVFILLSIIWGTTWVAIKISLEGVPPFTGAALRFVIAILFLLIYSRLKNISLRFGRSDFKTLFISAILLYTVDYGLIYWAEQYLSAGVTAIFFATFPLFMAIFSNFVFKNEAFSVKKFTGVILGFSGVLVIFYDQLLITDYNLFVILAIIAVIVSASSAALSTIIVKKYLHGVNPASLTLHQMVWGVISLATIGIFSGELSAIQLNVRVMSAVGYLGIMGSALAFVMFYWLLKKMSAISLSFIIYITPVVALITDWFIFREVVAFKTIIGMLLIFSGVALSQRSRRSKAEMEQIVE